jgi:hypothetical protein
MIALGPRVKIPESDGMAAVTEPDQFVTDVLDIDSFEHDPESLLHTWPAKSSGWVFIKGLAEVDGNQMPTSVRAVYPLGIERLFATMLGREAKIRVDYNMGEAQMPFDQPINPSHPPTC